MFLFRQQAAELRGALFSVAALFFTFLWSLFLNFHLSLGRREQKFLHVLCFFFVPTVFVPTVPRLSPQHCTHCTTWVTGWFWNIRKICMAAGSLWFYLGNLAQPSCWPPIQPASLLVLHVGCVIAASFLPSFSYAEEKKMKEKQRQRLLPPPKRSV